jgi:hypothetical protein
MARRGGNAAGGILGLIVIAIYGLVMYWYITLPVLVIIGLIWLANKSTTPTPTVSTPSQAPKWREPYTPTPTYTKRRRSRSYRPRKPRVSKPKPNPNDITFG